jgi:hypothetical protein
MNINIHYVWAGIIAWSAVSLLAIGVIRFSDERRQDSRKRETEWRVQ